MAPTVRWLQLRPLLLLLLPEDANRTMRPSYPRCFPVCNTGNKLPLQVLLMAAAGMCCGQRHMGHQQQGPYACNPAHTHWGLLLPLLCCTATHGHDC
jgi:hypothetical protein